MENLQSNNERTIYLLCLSVNVIILVLLAVAFLIIVQRNLLNLSDFLHTEKPGMVIISVFESSL